MKRIWLVSVAVVALVLGVVGVVHASIPDGSGVIHGCYKTGNPAKGAVTVIDTDAGEACPSGTAPLNWNQTGPQGPAGAAVPVQYVEHVFRYAPLPPPNGDARYSFNETVTCPGTKTVLHGGLLKTVADPAWVAAGGGSPGQVRLIPETDIGDTSGGFGNGTNPMLLPFTGPTVDYRAWRFKGSGISPVGGDNTPYPVDVTFYVICSGVA